MTRKEISFLKLFGNILLKWLFLFTIFSSLLLTMSLYASFICQIIIIIIIMIWIPPTIRSGKGEIPFRPQDDFKINYLNTYNWPSPYPFPGTRIKYSIFHSSGSRSRYANSPCTPLSLQLQSRIITQAHKLVNYNFDSCLPSHSHCRGDLPRPDRPVAVAGWQSHRLRLLQRLPGQCQPVPVVQLEQLHVRDGRAEWECIPGNA